MKSLICSAGLLCAMAMLWAGPVFAQEVAAQTPPPPAEAEEEGLRLNFRGVSLDVVLDYLSKAAGFVIIRDTEVTGTVDVWSHQPLNKSEAVDLLNAILHTKGYAAVQNGRMLTIVRRDEALQRNIPVRKGGDPQLIPRNDEIVTQVIPVRHADARQLVENIRPFLAEYADVSANESSNAVVLTDTQNNIHRMVCIIQALDTAISEVSTVRVYELEHSDAAETAQLINEIFNPETGGGGDRRSRFSEFISRMRGRGGRGGPVH